MGLAASSPQGASVENIREDSRPAVADVLEVERHDKSVVHYTCDVDPSTTNLHVTATPDDPKAKVNITGDKNLITGENLLQILESRLDNVVYRMGFGMSRPQARQLVTHGNIEVNGRKVDIASYLVKAGDVIAIREIRKDNPVVKENMEVNSVRPLPEWLEVDREKMSGKVIRLANRDDIDLPVEEHLIVELYSK